MQNKLFGLTGHKLLAISNGNLELNEYVWEMYPNNKPSGSKDLGKYKELKFVSKEDSQTLLVFSAPKTLDIVKTIAIAAVTRDTSKSNYACVLASPCGYKERLLAKSLLVYLILSINYVMIDGTVKKIRNENYFTNIEQQSGTHARKREKMEIMKDVLNFIRQKDGASITNIITKCNLNYTSALKILDRLIEKDYLEIEIAGIKNIYVMTDKARSFLETVPYYEI